MGFLSLHSELANRKAMRAMTHAAGVMLAVFLTACGGHKKSASPPNEAPDTTAPIMSGLTTSFVSPGNMMLTASGVDNVGITGYCFANTPAQPSASDGCFQAAAQKAINISLPVQRYYVWAKDAAGNVSNSSSVGPCSSAGFTASDGKSLKTVCMMTSLGELVLELEGSRAPGTVANFLKYVNDGFYSNTVFHRVMSNFMVQAGGFTWTSATGFASKSPTYNAIAMELPSTTSLSHISGTIAMARTSDLNSATSQFFINVVDNLSFDSDATPYAVFGRVISGNSTLSTLKTVPVVDNGSGEVSAPTNPPVIQWAIQLK